MKKKVTWFVYTILLALVGCEEVVDVEVPDADIKLVVNAVLRVDDTQEYVPVEIRVTESSGYFSENKVTSLDNAVIFYGTPRENAPELFEELYYSQLAEKEPGSGIYIPDPNSDRNENIPVDYINFGDVFNLLITHKGRRYLAMTHYMKAVPIDTLQQGEGNLFGTEDTEIKVTFTDTPGTQDHYIVDFGLNQYLPVEDQFVDGQEFQFSYYYDQKFDAGTVLSISLLGADQDFYNYMGLIVEQTQDNGGVFQTPVATARGNVFDITGIDNTNLSDNVQRPNDYALGYFAVVQEYKKPITIK